MRVFLLAVCVLAAIVGVRGQAPTDKITSEEYIEANELARNFFARFIKTMDIRRLINELGTSDFDQCIGSEDFNFVRSEQLAKISFRQRIRLYDAETNFSFALFLWGSRQAKDDDIAVFGLLPKRVQRAVSRKIFDEMIKNDDSESSSHSDKANLEYVTRVVTTLERANPIFRNEVRKVRAARSDGFREAMRFLEFESTIATYLFAPELDNDAKTCGSVAIKGRVIYVDIPFFQLQMVRDRGRLRIFQMPFHVD